MSGDSTVSFEAVFRQHFADIYGYVAFRLSPQVQDAQDMTQEVFVAGLRAWGSFRGDTTPLQWLRAIARKKLADYFERKRTSISIEAVRPSAEIKVDPGAMERAEMLSATMRAIPQEYAELLEEKYLDGLAVCEIARRRRKSEKAIESSLSRARVAFREKFLQCRSNTGDLS